MNELIQNVLAWGEAKGITGPEGKGTLLGQLSKTAEELTETRDAAVRLGECHVSDEPQWLAEIKDGIGDTVVTLILAAEMAGLTIEECLAAAYQEIKGRTGSMQNGIFVKDSNQPTK